MPSSLQPQHDLSRRDAVRLPLAACGLARARPARPGPAAIAAMFERLWLVQIDSVNILARAHYMPGFARLGPYDPALLDRAAQGMRRTLFEYWGHEASLIRLDLQPSLRWRMMRARDGRGIYAGLAAFGRERADFVASVLRQVEASGPVAARELEAAGRARGGWWGWSEGKRALEWLFWAGLVTTHSRRGFERIYDLPERVFPAVAAQPTPPTDEAQRTLIMVAAAALGVATAGDLRAYWRIGPEDAATRLRELVESGRLVPVAVEGWRQIAYLPPQSPPMGRPRASCLVSPFDPLLWERDRAERLFGFRYRIEIYTPAHLREHGYYVLPFLQGDRIVARLDLKADRQARRLLVLAAHREGSGDPDAVAAAVAEEMRLLAGWLALDTIAVADRGDLAPALAGHLGESGLPASTARSWAGRSVPNGTGRKEAKN
jgi:uncharacterized protein YcaQ